MPPKTDHSWFNQLSGDTYEAGAKAVGVKPKQRAVSARDKRARERLGGDAPAIAPRSLYTIEATEGWEDTYRKRYRQILLDKFMRLDEESEVGIMESWRKILAQEPYGTEDPTVRVLRQEVVEEFQRTLDLGENGEDGDILDYIPVTPPASPPQREQSPVKEAENEEPKPAPSPVGSTQKATGPTASTRKFKTVTKWVDIDGDGDLDMVVTQVGVGEEGASKVYEQRDWTGEFESKTIDPVDITRDGFIHHQAHELEAVLEEADRASHHEHRSISSGGLKRDLLHQERAHELDEMSKRALARRGHEESVTSGEFRAASVRF